MIPGKEATTLEMLEALQEVRAEAQALEDEVRQRLGGWDGCLCNGCLSWRKKFERDGYPSIDSERPPYRAGGTRQTAIEG